MMNANSKQLPLQTRDGQNLNGVLEWVEKAHSAALILPGSGNVGLNGDVSSPYVGHGYQGKDAPLSDQIASKLAEMGISSYRYSKRGVENPAELANQNFPFLLSDAQDALALIMRQVGARRIIVIGFSEGALLATHLATSSEIDGLFLLGTPSRSVDELFEYQFSTWPKRILRRLAKGQDSKIELSAFPALSVIPGSGGVPIAAIDLDQDGFLDLETDLPAFFSAFLQQIHATVDAMPPLAAWRDSMRKLPRFTEVAAQIKAPVYLYHGEADSQVNISWIREDSSSFPNLAALRVFEGLGHAFSPFEGPYGDVKTSGPFCAELLDQLGQDLKAFLSSHKS